MISDHLTIIPWARSGESFSGQVPKFKTKFLKYDCVPPPPNKKVYLLRIKKKVRNNYKHFITRLFVNF